MSPILQVLQSCHAFEKFDWHWQFTSRMARKGAIGDAWRVEEAVSNMLSCVLQGTFRT